MRRPPPPSDDADADLQFLQDWLGRANMQNTVIYAVLVSHG
jgi:hypothetical protein